MSTEQQTMILLPDLFYQQVWITYPAEESGSSDVRASSFRASGGREPAFFEISGFGRVRVV